MTMRLLYLFLRKVYRKRVIFTMLCFYAFTFVILLDFHLRYTKDHFAKSVNFVSKLSRSIKSLPDKTKIGDSEQGNWEERADKQDNEFLEYLRDLRAVQNSSAHNAKKSQRNVYQDVQIIENILFPNQVMKADDETWQNVTSDGQLYVFSALYEFLEGRPTVRVLGINGNTYLPKPYCQFQEDDGIVVTVKGKVWMLPDHHEKQFRTIFFFCPVPDERRPFSVSVISQKQPELLNAIKIIYNDEEMRNFTLCLSPLHFNYSVHYELIQWFELNKILGADYFYVYKFSSTGKTEDILKHYSKEGWIKVIQWDLPKSDVHYYGQMAVMNDCLFRNYRISKYIINTDIDEYIVPRRGISNLDSLIKVLPPNYCEYNIRSSILVSESKGVYEGKEMAKALHLDVLLKLLRREYIFPKNVRSKYIANTTCVDTAGIHYNWKYKTSDAEYQKYHVMPHDALLFHYRSEPMAKDVKEAEEKAVYKFGNELINNVKQRWKKINKEGNIILK